MDFPYQTLTQGQIRLLTIDLTEGEPFQLSLNHYPYDASLKYNALSYAWNPPVEGNGPPQVQVRCDTASFELSADLYQAIKSLAILHISRPIWIDCICIDQSNIKEKEWQLPLMGNYYSRAKMVWIWLGESYGNSDSAMEAMAGLALKLPILRVSQPIDDAWLFENELPLGSDGLWDGIDYIYTREWFNRLWTMQEFVLAGHSTFVCGLAVATGAQLVTVAQEFVRLGLVAVSRRGRVPHVGYKDGYHFSTFESRYRRQRTIMAIYHCIWLYSLGDSKKPRSPSSMIVFMRFWDSWIVRLSQESRSVMNCHGGRCTLRLGNYPCKIRTISISWRNVNPRGDPRTFLPGVPTFQRRMRRRRSYMNATSQAIGGTCLAPLTLSSQPSMKAIF